MILGFDGLTITAQPGGVGTFARRLLAALAARADAPEIVVALPLDSAADADLPAAGRVRILRAPVPGPDTPRALWYQHARLPRLMRDAGVTVHFAPAFVLPAFRFAIPSAVLVHDFAWRRFPDSKSRRFRLYMDRVVPDALRRAGCVFTPSSFVRDEVRAAAPGRDPASVVVLTPGPGTPRAAGDAAEVLARRGIERPFLLAVSNFDARKNLPALVAAWRRLRTDDGLPHALVLAGGGGARVAEFRAEVGGEDEPLHLPGFVDDADLGALYAAADLVVVPSLYEGFGFPVVEAFAAGAPVACADAGSLAEVAGDAAVRFDPRDSGAMARAIRTALEPGPEREARVRRGRERAAGLSWDRCAGQVLETLAAVDDGGGR